MKEGWYTVSQFYANYLPSCFDLPLFHEFFANFFPLYRVQKYVHMLTNFDHIKIHVFLLNSVVVTFIAINYRNVSIRVVFTREKFLHFICSLQSGNLSDSNNPLTKMHTLTHSGHLKYNVEKWKKSSTNFNIIFLAIICALN